MISKRVFVGKSKGDVGKKGSGKLERLSLTRKVKKIFGEIKTKKDAVRIPAISTLKGAIRNPPSSLPNSAIIQIMISSAAEQAQKASKEEVVDNKAGKKYKILDEGKESGIGGYGAVRPYSSGTFASYLDYSKLFSYLGKFRAFSSYFSAENAISPENSSQRQAAELDAIEKGVRHIKYLAHNHEINTISAVPIAGMDSSEWEKFKLWMKLDPVMYRLKTSTS